MCRKTRSVDATVAANTAVAPAYAAAPASHAARAAPTPADTAARAAVISVQFSPQLSAPPRSGATAAHQVKRCR